MGALVTLELPEDSPILSFPWIITFGPLGEDEDWEPVVCGPYERPHALLLAEAVVADEDLVGVVEPLLSHVTVDEIRAEIAAARAAAAQEIGTAEEGGTAEGGGYGDYEGDLDEIAEDERAEAAAPPSPDEIRAGIRRIAAKLTGAVS
ncbi:MAG TPA: hypothetical protein VHN18_06625 [Micromonosporaceae bacterium]|nr:hypothetical protein [Micromonosporaceae bacterium]